jgi:hypothetical protein
MRTEIPTSSRDFFARLNHEPSIALIARKSMPDCATRLEPVFFLFLVKCTALLLDVAKELLEASRGRTFDN